MSRQLISIQVRVAGLLLAIASGICLSPRSALGVVVVSGNGNTTAASLAAAGGPAVGSPTFGNVGLSSTTGASVTYLGNRWAITAGHVTISSGVGQVRFGGVGYTVDDASITYLTNPNNSQADLKLFRITTDPGLPSITSQLINDDVPTGQQIMIGNGLSIVVDGQGDAIQQFWHDDGVTDPWPDDATPGTKDADDYSGFDLLPPGSHTVRWGENEVSAVPAQLSNNTHVYHTAFDDLIYTQIEGLDSEAQGTLGDSGGGVFMFADGQWKLSGIMVGLANLFPPRQPLLGSAYYPVFGNETVIADLRFYRDQIIAIVPEPSGMALISLCAIALIGLAARRRCW